MNSSLVSVATQSPVVPQPYVEDLKIGDTVVWKDTFSQLFTWLVCLLHKDFNAVHWNWWYVRKTKFGRTIVHAITVWGRISRHLAKSYPGIAWRHFESDMPGSVPHGVPVTFTATVTRVEGNKAEVNICAAVDGRNVFHTMSIISSRKES